eukprot:scaffold11246_cov56-Phaeocystis_antarctica.AAC.2
MAASAAPAPGRCAWYEGGADGGGLGLGLGLGSTACASLVRLTPRSAASFSSTIENNPSSRGNPPLAHVLAWVGAHLG